MQRMLNQKLSAAFETWQSNAAQMKDEVRREVQFTVPPGSADLLKKLPGYENFNSMLEVFRLLRCGFGLKDAPRLWNKLLTEELKKIGARKKAARKAKKMENVKKAKRTRKKT